MNWTYNNKQALHILYDSMIHNKKESKYPFLCNLIIHVLLI
jgi:hypothetical protein